ncbi:MAG: hypothetical protein AAF682_19570 [Planctomycetota bacterium]
MSERHSESMEQLKRELGPRFNALALECSPEQRAEANRILGRMAPRCTCTPQYLVVGETHAEGCDVTASRRAAIREARGQA